MLNEVPIPPDQPDLPFSSNDLSASESLNAEEFDLVNGAPNDKQELFEGFHQLHPDLIRADRIAGLIFFGVVAIGMAIALFFIMFNGIDATFFILTAVAAVVAAGLLWTAIYWPKFEYKRTRWRLDEVGLEIHKGVLWRHRRVVPLARVQHADVGQGPIQRMYELATLTVHTAGTQSSSVDLSGLHHQVALHLRDRLVRQKLVESQLNEAQPNKQPALSSRQESTTEESLLDSSNDHFEESSLDE